MFQITALLGNIKVKFYGFFFLNFKDVFLEILEIVKSWLTLFCQITAGWYTPFGVLRNLLSTWGATETTYHSSERWEYLTKGAWDNFDKTGKKSFSYLEVWGQKSKKFS